MQSTTKGVDAQRLPRYERRLHGWRQLAGRRLLDAKAAEGFISEVGIVSVYPSSPEFANLFHAHVGDPEAKTESKWDSPSGFVYGWRWTLGRENVAFYANVIRKRPTFVRWELLPPMLTLLGDSRTPDELYDFGVISADAYRIAQVLDASDMPVGTGDLREAAGFPTGKERRAAYHKALDELESRLLITNEFVNDAEGVKHHGLMFRRHRAAVDEASKLTSGAALPRLLQAYLPAAGYVVPAIFAKHLRLKPSDVTAACRELESRGLLESVDAGATQTVFRWTRPSAE